MAREKVLVGRTCPCDAFAISVIRNATPCDVNFLEVVQDLACAIDERHRVARWQLVSRPGDAIDILSVGR